MRTSERMSAIEVDGLTKVYRGGITAVNAISFTVGQGEIFGFLGPNGAGKSTTIQMLTTLIRPTAGRALVMGIDVARRADEARQQLGYVSQDLAVDDCLTGRENLSLQARFYGLPRQEARKRIDEVLDLVGLADRAGDLVETYSGGMRKRLDIAGALVHRPAVLLLDEPTLGLDSQTRTAIWDYVRQLRTRAGITVFVTTHYIDEADGVCDRIAVIDKGEIRAIGTPRELKARLRGQRGGVRGAGYPSLEDAYLAITGRAVRAESGNAEEARRRRALLRRVRGT
ncbi:MAG: ATP-binding cassette domain-containing protein [Spirochaetes bacterium]|nr:ATP-binding cassette domain-containing protein [Spirochaetota bacterium]